MTAPVLAADAPLFVVSNPRSGRGAWDETRQALEEGCRAAGRPLTLLALQRGQPLERVITQAVQGALANGGIAVAVG
ncbi:MAG: diacylglycerol kinase, partial [Comamonadaceae bacterium]